MIGPWPCAYACAYVDPVLTSQSYVISISTRRMNMSVFLVLVLTVCCQFFHFLAYAYAQKPALKAQCLYGVNLQS